MVLTAKDRAVYDCIVTYVSAHGYPPSIREIGEMTNTKSSSTVYLHLSRLRDFGYLESDHDFTARAYRVKGCRVVIDEPIAI